MTGTRLCKVVYWYWWWCDDLLWSLINMVYAVTVPYQKIFPMCIGRNSPEKQKKKKVTLDKSTGAISCKCCESNLSVLHSILANYHSRWYNEQCLNRMVHQNRCSKISALVLHETRNSILAFFVKAKMWKKTSLYNFKALYMFQYFRLEQNLKLQQEKCSLLMCSSFVQGCCL